MVADQCASWMVVVLLQPLEQRVFRRCGNKLMKQLHLRPNAADSVQIVSGRRRVSPSFTISHWNDGHCCQTVKRYNPGVTSRIESSGDGLIS